MVFAIRVPKVDLEDAEREFYAVYGVDLWKGMVWREWAHSKKWDWATLALWLTFRHIWRKAMGAGIFGSTCSLELMQCAPAIASVIPGTTNYDLSGRWYIHALLEAEYEPEESRIYSSMYGGFIEIRHAIKAKTTVMPEEADWEGAMYDAREYKIWGATQPTSTVI